nr:T6SS immunity protein Tli4 family protein [Cupriavidus gilardii]
MSLSALRPVFQGRDRSLSEQNIAVNLQALEQSVVTLRTPYQPAFQSDEQAIQLWDAIINSIRLRPGAA